MSNPLNELSKVYKKQIASESVALPPETIVKVGQYTRQIRYHARKEDIPIPKAFNDIASKSNMSGTERGAVRKKLGLAESGMPNVDPKDKAVINKRSKGLFKKDLTGDVQGVNETSLSNWRHELREMEEEVPSMKKISADDGEIKEKKVKNKVIINPPMGNMESVIKDMGGTLLEVKEIVEGKCEDCDCKGCGDDGVGHQNPCVECGGHHKEEKQLVSGQELKYCKRCKKPETRNDCAYGPEEWDRSAVDIELGEESYLEAFKALTPDKKRQIKNQAERRKKSADRSQMSSDYETSTKQDQQVRNMKKVSENVAGIALSSQELNTQKRMAMLNVKLAKERKNSINRIKKSEVEEGYDTKKREEVIKALKKKKEEFKKRYGKDAPDVMYAVAAKTAKKKGDTSKSDDKYAYEEVVLEGDRPKNAYPANLRAKTMMMNKKDRQKHFDAYDKSNPVKKSVVGEKFNYDPMDDPDFDHDEAEKKRGVSGKNNPKGGKKFKKLTKEEVVDKALANVISNIRKSGGVMASDLPKATDKQKAEWKAERARRSAQKKSTGNPYKPRQGESD